MNQSPWLFLDAADTIFSTAKRRVYTGAISDKEGAHPGTGIPQSLKPVLEEQPKWAVLSEILEEIEQDIYFNPTISDDSNGTTLIMGGDQQTCRQIREYLQSMEHAQPDEPDFELQNGNPNRGVSAALMMKRKLRNYLVWKRDFAKVSTALFSENEKSINGQSDPRSNTGNKGRAPANKRRRVRGGGAMASAPNRTVSGNFNMAGDRDAHIASLMQDLQPTEGEADVKAEIATDPLDKMEESFKLLEMQDLLLVHPYDGDKDDHVLEEVKPRYIIMYEPDPAFIRRVEVYRSSHTDRNVRVYFMYYKDSVEERRFLSALRREKDAFTKLIQERAVRTMVFGSWCLYANTRPRQ